eukprot:gene13267-13398_t
MAPDRLGPSSVFLLIATLCMPLNALGQYADWSTTGGFKYTKLTATYSLGDVENSWYNITQANFTNWLLPSFLADNPATTAPWVKAKSSELSFILRLELIGTVPKAVKAAYLSWELAKPLASLFTTAASIDVAATVNSTADTTQQLLVAILLTFKELPSGTATSVTASSIITQLQDTLKNMTSAGQGTNAALFLKNITSVQPKATTRLTNATFTFVVPSHDNVKQYTYEPLKSELTRNEYSTGLPWPNEEVTTSESNITAVNSTSAGVKSTNTTADTAGSSVEGKSDVASTSSGTATFPKRRLAQYSSYGPQVPSPALKQPVKMRVPLKMLAVEDDDVTSFFAGSPDAYDVKALMCQLTNDPCCTACDPAKDSLTLNDLLCFAKSSTPCWQRNYGCGDFRGDLAILQIVADGQLGASW